MKGLRWQRIKSWCGEAALLAFICCQRKRYVRAYTYDNLLGFGITTQFRYIIYLKERKKDIIGKNGNE